MNAHTVPKEIPGYIKPMVASAEAFRDAIAEPKKMKVVQSRMGQDKKSHKSESDSESSNIKRGREEKNPASNKYAGSCSKAPPET